MSTRFPPLPSRALSDPTSEQNRRDVHRAIEELRREVELLRARVYALENP